MDAGGWVQTGLPAVAEQVLAHLVTRPESTAASVAADLGLPEAAVRRAVQALEAELLAVRVGRHPARWSASPPRAAVQAMLARRRAQLASLEVQAERLQEQYNAHLDRRFAADQFEVLDTPERVTVRYEHLLRSARRAVSHLVMPPYLAASEQRPERMRTVARSAARGVVFRSLYDAGTFDDDVSVATAREADAFGADVRLSSGLPMKLVLFDDDVAIMTIIPDEPAAGSLLVYSPPLLRVLHALFEGLWEHGVPWSQATTVAAARPSPASVDERAARVLQLMSLGMKDDAIARVLGVSRRTVQQEVSDIGARLGARTRFQIALQAQKRGWLPEP